MPKVVVEDHGLERTDIGNLGSGIYFSDSVRFVKQQYLYTLSFVYSFYFSN